MREECSIIGVSSHGRALEEAVDTAIDIAVEEAIVMVEDIDIDIDMSMSAIESPTLDTV
jgi:hypothetical protein